MRSSTRFLVPALLLLPTAIAFAPRAQRPAAAAGSEAVNPAGVYKGTFKTSKGAKGQLEVDTAEVQDGSFSGSASITFKGVTEEFVGEGTFKTKKGVIHFKDLLTSTETTDGATLTGILNRKKHKITGTFKASIGEKNVHGTFAIVQQLS